MFCTILVLRHSLCRQQDSRPRDESGDHTSEKACKGSTWFKTREDVTRSTKCGNQETHKKFSEWSENTEIVRGQLGLFRLLV